MAGLIILLMVAIVFGLLFLEIKMVNEHEQGVMPRSGERQGERQPASKVGIFSWWSDFD